MNGLRKQAKPTAKEALARLEKLELENAMLRLDIRNRISNFLTQMSIIDGIFNAVLDQAATVGEARRWYSEWVSDVNSLEIDRYDYKEQLQAIIDKHGFEFSIPDHGELVDKIWEGEE